jgi:hypothetical protein
MQPLDGTFEVVNFKYTTQLFRNSLITVVQMIVNVSFKFIIFDWMRNLLILH